MNRRSFIRGMLVTAGAGTALVKLATPSEVDALTVAQPVALGNVERQYLPNFDSPEVYVRRGSIFVCVGMITSLRVTNEINNMISWTGDTILMPGLKRGEMTFEGQFEDPT